MQKGSRGAGAGLFGRLGRREEGEREVSRADDEWQETLTPEQYRVLRKRGTEAPFSNETVVPDADGLYRCAACDAALFHADTKFDSGTGWPSFTEPAVADAVTLRRDFGLGMIRREVRCRRCGGHLGHVFGDGPGGAPRYCINSCALDHDPRRDPPTPGAAGGR